MPVEILTFRDDQGLPILEKCPEDGCEATGDLLVQECSPGRTWMFTVGECGHWGFIMSGPEKGPATGLDPEQLSGIAAAVEEVAEATRELGRAAEEATPPPRPGPDAMRWNPDHGVVS